MKTSSRPPTSAFLPTPVQHVCRPTSTPMLNRFYLLYISLFFSPLSYLYVYGVPLSASPPARQKTTPPSPCSSRVLSGVVVGGQRVNKSLPVSLRWPIDPGRPLLSLARPGFSTPDSGSRCKTAPWSPQWLIARCRPPKPSPAKDFSQPCRHQSAADDVMTGNKLSLTRVASFSVVVCVAAAVG